MRDVSFPKMMNTLKTQIKLTPSVMALFAANGVPVLGVLFLGWELFPLIFVYWLENGVVGVFTMLKLLTNRAPASNRLTSHEPNPFTWWESRRIRFNWWNLGLVLFFIVHYGVFWQGHGAFVCWLFGEKGDTVMRTPQIIVRCGLQYTLLALVLSHGFSFAYNYIGRGEYKSMPSVELMFAPYRRVIVLHLFVLFGGIVLMALGVSRIGLLLLAAVKIVADLHGHSFERTRAMMTATIQGPKEANKPGGR